MKCMHTTLPSSLASVAFMHSAAFSIRDCEGSALRVHHEDGKQMSSEPTVVCGCITMREVDDLGGGGLKGTPHFGGVWFGLEVTISMRDGATVMR